MGNEFEVIKTMEGKDTHVVQQHGIVHEMTLRILETNVKGKYIVEYKVTVKKVIE